MSLLCISNSDAALLTGSARPCFTSLPPSMSLHKPPPPPPPLFLCICMPIVFFYAAHVLTMCSSSLFPHFTLLSLFCLIQILSHILSWYLILLQNDPHPLTHTYTQSHTVTCICVLSSWVLVFSYSNGVSRFVCAGRTYGVAKAALMYIWAAVFIGWDGQITLWCSRGYIWLSSAQSKTVAMHSLHTCICIQYVDKHTRNINH